MNLVEIMWLSRYPIPIEIMYDQGKEFIRLELRKSLIETEYRITAKPSTPESTMSNAKFERIQQVLGKLVCTFNIQHIYVDKNDPCTGILDTAAFNICSTTNSQKYYILGQLIFCCDTILSIKHRVDWELIRQK